jgi:hypothetical protein
MQTNQTVSIGGGPPIERFMKQSNNAAQHKAFEHRFKQ